MHDLSLMLIGFSLFSGMLLCVSQFSLSCVLQLTLSRLMSILCVVELSCIQLAHFLFIQNDVSIVNAPAYLFCLYLFAPSFYLFSRQLLLAKSDFSYVDLLHFVPAFLFLLLPTYLQFPVAFIIGTFYLMWLLRCVYVFRASRANFRLELLIFFAVLAIALIVITIGVGLVQMSDKTLIQLYSILLGCIFFLINLVVILSPRLLEDVSDLAQETYAQSTLTNVDVQTTLTELKQLLEGERLFVEPDLDLNALASKLSLSSHQLSELVNTQYGIGFSRYIREFRIKEAKKLLIGKPSFSVITVGLEVGFSSQSNFYQAFKEITGISPGKFRKIQASDK